MSRERQEFRDENSEEGRRGRGGAQTFRRGRAIHFYEQLTTKRDTLKAQLGAEELKSIHPVIAGELKAIEMVMSEFKVAFKLDELMNKKEEE